MENTLNLFYILSTLKKRWKLLVSITLFAALLCAVVSYFVLTPIYQASTQILVNQKNTNNQLDASLLRSNIDLINTYSVIIKSPAILEKVIDELALNQNVEELNKSIEVNSENNSQVISLTVENPNAMKAVQIANAISETFQKNIPGIMSVDNVSILAKAELKEQPVPVRPDPLLYTLIAVVAGLMIGIGLAFTLEFMDTTLKVDEDVAVYLGLPVLGTIPKMANIHRKGEGNLKIRKKGSEVSGT